MINARFTRASEVFEAFPTLQQDMTTQGADQAPLAFLKSCTEGEHPEDAITFAAYLLDRRSAVWWACHCARQMGSPVNRDEEIALLMAEAWVREPEEHRRVAALNLGLGGDHKLAGTWLALAAGAAGGTFMVDDSPGPPVPPNLCARSARSAVFIALARMPFRERPKFIAQCSETCRTLLQRA